MSKSILIVDRQVAGPHFLASELTEAGFSALVHARYDYLFPRDSFDGKAPDLVILCCKEIESEELEFIRSLLLKSCLLIVCCAALQRGDPHLIVLANPYEVGEEFPNPDHLIELVEEAFLNAYRKAALRDTHRLGSGLGSVQLYIRNIRQILNSNNIVNTNLDEELTKVSSDVKSVLERSKGLQRLASIRMSR